MAVELDAVRDTHGESFADFQGRVWEFVVRYWETHYQPMKFLYLTRRFGRLSWNRWKRELWEIVEADSGPGGRYKTRIDRHGGRSLAPRDLLAEFVAGDVVIEMGLWAAVQDETKVERRARKEREMEMARIKSQKF